MLIGTGFVSSRASTIQTSFGQSTPPSVIGLVAHHEQPAIEEGQHGVGEAGERRVVVPAADEPGMRHVRDVEDDGAAVEIADVGAVGALGVDVGVVGAEAGVELRMAHGGGSASPSRVPGSHQRPTSRGRVGSRTSTMR